MNNIFDFATKELSQDAVICWIVNWYNDKQSKLYPLAVELLKKFIDFDENTDTEVSIQKQLFKIDILIYFKKSGKTVIVEDKVYSSEHDGQIAQYRKTIAGLSAEEKCNLEIKDVQEDKISSVYFKTGFFYDNDKLVVADRVINGSEFLKIIEPYRDMDYLLQMYYEYLQRLVGWYKIHGDFTKKIEESSEEWNVSKHQIAQYNLMRYIFPEDTWNKTKWEYRVYHGSNKNGRTWTEMMICQGSFTEKNYPYEIFWRIDTDHKGPYISLRFYNVYDKSNDREKQEHTSQYKHHKELVEDIFSSAEKGGLWDFKQVNPGKKENHNEASLLLLHIDGVLKNWNKEKEEFVRRIRFITDEFLRKTGR